MTSAKEEFPIIVNGTRMKMRRSLYFPQWWPQEYHPANIISRHFTTVSQINLSQVYAVFYH